ncbi:MAG: hypothetical protein SVR08_10870 [Spirochaetota bacterium]|nr:hypothetical protein [Spirochaetota bacterium]
MRQPGGKINALFLVIILLFIIAAGFLWLDHIGIINLSKIIKNFYKKEIPLVLDAKDDEPSLIALEEFEKEKQKLIERIENLDKREALIIEKEKELEKEKEELEAIRKGLQLERKKLDNEIKSRSGYKKNVIDLANKVSSMRPEEAVEIMIKWDDALLIDVLRQIDINAEEVGTVSITSYLISLMPREKASSIMYLMTQL